MELLEMLKIGERFADEFNANGLTLVKEKDKNGTIVYSDCDYRCKKCGGTGYIDVYYYNEGGVCFQCGGTGQGGTPTSYKVYERDYLMKLLERRRDKALEKAEKMNAEFLARRGFGANGEAFAVLGAGYDRKDELKEKGAKFLRCDNGGVWYFSNKVDGYELMPFTADEVFYRKNTGELFDWGGMTDERLDFYAKFNSLNSAYVDNNSAAEYVGEVGQAIELELVCNNHFQFSTHYTYSGELMNVYKFKDNNGNVIIWKTSSSIDWFIVGDAVRVKATVKEHKPYKDEKQTSVIRLKKLA